MSTTTTTGNADFDDGDDDYDFCVTESVRVDGGAVIYSLRKLLIIDDLHFKF